MVAFLSLSCCFPLLNIDFKITFATPPAFSFHSTIFADHGYTDREDSVCMFSLFPKESLWFCNINDFFNCFKIVNKIPHKQIYNLYLNKLVIKGDQIFSCDV